MSVIKCLEENYYKTCEIKNDNYELKMRELMEVLKNIMKLQGSMQPSSLSQYLIELRKMNSSINEINWSDEPQRKKEALLERCRVMIEVYLGQAVVLELECSKWL